MTQEELNAMVDAEAQRLGTGCSAFMERHREIMELADQIQQQYEKRPCQSTVRQRQSNPSIQQSGYTDSITRLLPFVKKL